MVTTLSKRIVEKSIASGVIRHDEDEFYTFAFSVLIFQTAFCLAIVTLGAILGFFRETVLHILCFLPIRTFAGGYHQDTRSKCFMGSMLLYAAVFTAFFFIPWSILAYIFYPLLFGSTAVIFRYAPVAAPNKPLQEKEKHIYRKISRAILSVELAVLLPMNLLNASSAYIFFAGIGIIITAVLMVVSIKTAQTPATLDC